MTVSEKSKPPSKPESGSRAWEALTPALSEWILTAVDSMGFNRMTPVQASTIPLFVGNKDVVVEAVTGSGKTLAFLIPVVERLLRLEEPIKKHHVGAIVISPTRELATQIYNVLTSLLAYHGPSAAAMRPPDEDAEMGDGDQGAQTYSVSTLRVIPQLLVGGTTTPAEDLRNFLQASPNLLVATPGRLLELLSSPHVHCPQSSFEVLVMDEADRLLDLGFKDDLQKILARLPKQRRTGLFSASVSEAVDQIVRVGLRNPVRISVKVRSSSGKEEKRTPASLQMSYMITPPMSKFPTLLALLRQVDPVPQKTIVYTSTCAAVDYLQHILPAILPSSVSAVSLHGKMPPNARTKNFAKFADSVTPTLLLTTDVAARGLDIPQVDLVIQLDPPSDPKVFLHRCGRAGRAGRKGLAVTFLTPGREEDYIEFLRVRQTPIDELNTPRVSIHDSEAQAMIDSFRKLVLKDRALHDKAQRAFVSWVQAYSKHTASSIFRVQNLQWEELAKSWGLLQLPKMPELKTWSGDRSLGMRLEWDKYSYKDKMREKHRLEQLSLKNLTEGGAGEDGSKDTAGGGKSKATKRSEAWSQQKESRETRDLRREKKRKRREMENLSKMSPEERKKQEELHKMVQMVREQTSRRPADEEFEGFSD